LVIGDFVIEGIDDDANRAHARLFYEQLLPMMQNSGPSWKLSARKKYDRIMDVMVRIRTGDKMGEVQTTYPQAYKWRKTYALVLNCAVATRRGVNATRPAVRTTTSAPTTTATNKGKGGGVNPN
jgi:hypothetical protein